MPGRDQGTRMSGAEQTRLASTLNLLLNWLDFLLEKIGPFRNQVQVRQQQTAEGTLTYVTMKCRIAAPHGGLGLLLTTERQRLSTREFGTDLAARFNRRPEQRGRTVYCLDQENEQLMAAIMYHVDPRRSLPLLITAVAVREDGDPEFVRVSRACALTTKTAVHAIGGKLGRGATVAYDARTAPEVAIATDELGFTRASVPTGLSPNGTYLEQQPLTPDGLPKWIRKQLRDLARGRSH